MAAIDEKTNKSYFMQMFRSSDRQVFLLYKK